MKEWTANVILSAAMLTILNMLNYFVQVHPIPANVQLVLFCTRFEASS